MRKMKERAEQRRRELSERKHVKHKSVNERPLYLKLEQEIPEWQTTELEQ